MKQLSVVEFQYNDKKNMAIGHTPFKLNFGKHLQKRNLIIRIKLPKLSNFLEELQRSWEKARKSINMVKETIKKQFDKKRRNSQGLKVGDNMWLKAKNTHLKQSSKKLDQKIHISFGLKKYQLRNVSD